MVRQELKNVKSDRTFLSKLKTFADDKSKLAKMMKFVLDSTENIAPSFSPFPRMFLTFSFSIICSASFVCCLLCTGLKPFPNNKSLDSSKLKEFSDDDFKFDVNGRKFSEWLENTVGKREIARYEQISPFPAVFSKRLALHTRKNNGLVLETVNPLQCWSQVK